MTSQSVCVLEGPQTSLNSNCYLVISKVTPTFAVKPLPTAFLLSSCWDTFFTLSK